MKIGISVLLAFSCLNLAQAAGLSWPDNQLLPTFAAPAPVLDVIDVSSSSSAEIDLFASLEGIVNRAQPQVACVSSMDGEGKLTWLNLHNLAYNLTNGYNLILKYRTNFTGLVVTDPNQADTLNLATTMAGVNNELICDPSLLPTLTNSPYNLPVLDDLRGRFTDKYAVYGYLYTNYWQQCTHRIIAGMETNVDGNLRDYLVAVKSATVWLDPGNTQDAALLGKFLANMNANDGVYMGWWPSEDNGLGWIAQYGIPVLASDFFRNGSVFSGVARTISVPDIPPTPPLQNKIYVALILSDGDNVQYMQHVMKMDWSGSARGSMPISWTSESLSVDLDPGLFSYYWSTVTTNDCLISGPSGAGYAHVENWSAANLSAFAKVSASYLQRSGLRVITVWDLVNSGIAQAYATNCPTLLGLTDQSGTYSAVNLGLRTIKLTPTYASTDTQMISGITNAAAGWNGSAPVFVAAQATVWSLGPSDLQTIANTFDTNKFVFVRADHLFLMANGIFGAPGAVTRPTTGITPTSATIQGTVVGNANNAVAWFDWGTNSNYGSKTAIINVGSASTNLSVVISGLNAWQTYHCRIVASNLLGVARGSDQIFTTGGHLQVWGSGPFGETNAPKGLTNVVGIASGSYHGLELGNDGKVTAWGYNGFGQTNVPAGLTNVIAVAAGIKHSLALLGNGMVTAWGDNSYGQTNIPFGLSNVTSIAAGAYFNLALKANQTVTAWGDNTYGQTNVPAGLSNVVGIAAGYGHGLALKADGTVTAWGNNSYGQTNVPSGLDDIIAVAAGQYHSLALKANGFTLSNLIPACRWTADSLTGSNGSSVSSWTDTIAGKNATQPFIGNQPAFYSNVINGHNTIRFSGDQYLTVSARDSPVSAAGSFTLAVVFKTSTPGNSSGNFYQNTGLLGAEQPGVVTDWALCINGNQLGAGLGAGTGGCGSDLSLYGGNVTDGNPHIAMYVRVGDVVKLYVDGLIVASQSGLCPEARGDYPFQIGALITNLPNSYFFTGDFAEVQIYNRALTSWEVTSVNEMLAATYGIGGAAGAMVVWGNNANGQANVPVTVTNLSAVASGSEFNLALQADGTVTGWGNDAQGQITVPVALTNVAAISGGVNFSLAIGNQPPVACNAVVSGYVNHDLQIALPADSPDDVPLNFQVESLPLSGALYQNSNGACGSLINTPGTLVSDAGGRVIFAPAPDDTGSPAASFTFLADDGKFNSGPAQVAVNIRLPVAPQFTSEFWDQGSGSFNLNFSGSSNAAYSVWTSTNLMDWVNLGAATEASPGQYEFINTNQTGLPQQFYRASAP